MLLRHLTGNSTKQVHKVGGILSPGSPMLPGIEGHKLRIEGGFGLALRNPKRMSVHCDTLPASHNLRFVACPNAGIPLAASVH